MRGPLFQAISPYRQNIYCISHSKVPIFLFGNEKISWLIRAFEENEERLIAVTYALNLPPRSRTGQRTT